MLAAAGVSRAVRVQPSVYGSDNRLLLGTLAAADPAHWRGVAVLAGDESDSELAGLLQAGRAWVKLTGPHRLTREALAYPAVDEFAAALRETAPQRLVWGSDWPHVMLKGNMPNDAELVDLIERWLPAAAEQQQVLVDNPQALYGFAL